METLKYRRTFCNLLSAALLVLGFFPVQMLQAQTTFPTGGTVDKEALYAAFILNIARFVRWPDGAMPTETTPLVIGTFMRDPINEVLERYIEDERVNGRAVNAIRLHSLDDLARCQVVFISRSNQRQAAAVLARIRNKAVLAISDAESFLQIGGHVVLVPSSERMRLRVHLGNLDNAGLVISSKLLRLSEVVDKQ